MSLPSVQDIAKWARASRNMGPKATLELERMRTRAGEHWQELKLPRELLALPKPLRAIVQSGVDLRLDRFDSKGAFEEKSVRALALFQDAPRETHLFLDEVGEPPVSWDYASRACLHFIDRLLLNSATEMAREFPEQMREAMSRTPSVAAIRTLAVHLKKDIIRSRALMQWATDLGADWEDGNHQELLKTHAKGKSFDLRAFEGFLATLRANHLQAQAPPAPSAVPRPRF